MNAHFLKS